MTPKAETPRQVKQVSMNSINHIQPRMRLLTALVLVIGLTLSGCSEQSPSDQQEAAQQAAKDTQTTQLTEQPVAATVNNGLDNDAVNAESAAPKTDGIESPLRFSLNDLEGNTVTAEAYRGKWLVLNYWATWCAPCRDEMPELVKFQAENDNVQVLGIAYEDATIEKLQNFAEDFGITYPLLTIDVYNPPGFAAEGGLGLPTTIVYNPEGMRHKKHMGPIDAEGLVELIQ